MDTTQVATTLAADLEAAVGDDERLRGAAGLVAMWATFTDPYQYEPVGSVALCRRGLVAGHARDLGYLKVDAEVMERTAVALRLLIAHTEATHPLARRRHRDRRRDR